jgi:hypothetical protein
MKFFTAKTRKTRRAGEGINKNALIKQLEKHTRGIAMSKSYCLHVLLRFVQALRHTNAQFIEVVLESIKEDKILDSKPFPTFRLQILAMRF